MQRAGLLNWNFYIQRLTKLSEIFKETEAGYSYIQRWGISTGRRKNYLLIFFFSDRNKKIGVSQQVCCCVLKMLQIQYPDAAKA